MPFLRRSAVGLDISDRSIEAVLVVRSGGRLTVASYGRIALPPGLVEDGYVERRDELASLLRAFLRREMMPPLPHAPDRAVLAMPEAQVYSHMFEVPRSAEGAALRETLANAAEGLFPYRRAELVSTHAIANVRSEVKEAYFAAVHHETLKSWLAVCEMAGLKADVIETEPLAAARAILAGGTPDPALLVDIGARTADVAVLDRNGVQFSESLPVAGEAFTSAVADALGGGRERAEALKRMHGMTEAADPAARRALAKIVDRLAKHVREALDFYEKRSKRSVGRVMVTGGGALMPGFIEAFAEAVEEPDRARSVMMADPLAGLDVDPRLDEEELRARGPLLATAIGLALRGAGVRKFPDINFSERLDARADVVHAKTRPWIAAGLGFVALAAAALGVWQATGLFGVNPPEASTAEAPSRHVFDLRIPFAGNIESSVAPPMLRSFGSGVSVAIPVTIREVATFKEGYASGLFDIVNESARTQTLVERTRLLSDDGVLFRLDDGVTVPPGGQVSATATADVLGIVGEVDRRRFTIPGLPPSLQASVYAVSAGPMRDGIVLEPPVSAEETAGAIARAEFEALPALTAELLAATGDAIVPEGFVQVLSATATEPVSGTAGELVLPVEVSGIGHVFFREEALRIGREALREWLSGRADPAGYALAIASAVGETAIDERFVRIRFEAERIEAAYAPR